MPLVSTIHAWIQATQTLAADLGSGEFRLAMPSPRIELQAGTGANQADMLWSDRRTLAASATEDLDLAGTLTDGLGQPAVFATIKAILIKASAANTNDIIVGNAAANGFVGPFGAATHTVAVRPGGVALFVAPETGWTVTPSTADLLHVANGGAGTSVDYEVVLIGTSA